MPTQIGLWMEKLSFLRRHAVVRIGGNAAAVLFSNVVIKGSTFVVYALVARHLGADDFGRLSLALSLLYLFHIFAVAGVKTVTAREAARNQQLTAAYLIHGTLVVAGASLLSYGGMLIFVRFMHYPPETTNLIGILFVALAPYALSQVCEGIFQAWEKMHLIAWANIPVRIAQTVVIYQLLIGGSDIATVALTLAIAYWLLLLVEWVLLLRYCLRPRLQLDLAFIRDLVGTAATFLGIEGIIAIKTSVDLIVLSIFANEHDLGLFSAAIQVTVPLALIINNVVHSVFPLLCRKYDTGLQTLQWMVERLLELLLMLILPAVVGIVLLAEETLLLLYQDPAFVAATVLLQVVVWFALVNAFTTVLGQVLWASRREKRSFQIVLINTAIKLLSTVVFVSQFGLIGVLLSYVLTSLVSLLQHYLPVRRLLPSLAITRSLWKPVVATLCMAGLLLTTGELAYWLRILTAGLLYLVVLAGLIVWSSGGPQQLRLKYQFLWTS